MDTKTTLTDYYKLLKLAPNCGRDEIERAYREFHELYSPDTVGTYGLFSEDERAHMLKLINEAYEALTGHDVAQPILTAAGVVSGELDKGVQLKLVTLKGETVEKRKEEKAVEPAKVMVVNEVEQKKDQVVQEVALAASGSTHISFRHDTEVAAEPAAATTAPVTPSVVSVVPAVAAVAPAAPVLEGGAFLRSLRDAHQLSLQEIAKRTRISEKFLVAMENNDIPSLPARVYVQGFVRLYLKHLNQLKAPDAEKHLAQYMSYYESKKLGS